MINQKYMPVKYLQYIHQYNTKIKKQKEDNLRNLQKSKQEVEFLRAQQQHHHNMLQNLWMLQQENSKMAKQLVTLPGPALYNTFNAREKKNVKYTFSKDKRIFEKMTHEEIKNL